MWLIRLAECVCTWFKWKQSSGGSAARRGNRADYSFLSPSFIKREISGAVVRCLKYVAAATRLKVGEETCRALPPSPDTAALMWKHVWLRIMASSWSCIHHPLHVAPAHTGRRAGASGTLPVALIKEYEGCIQPACNSFVLLCLPSEICAARWARPSAVAKPRHYTTISA